MGNCQDKLRVECFRACCDWNETTRSCICNHATPQYCDYSETGSDCTYKLWNNDSGSVDISNLKTDIIVISLLAVILLTICCMICWVARLVKKWVMTVMENRRRNAYSLVANGAMIQLENLPSHVYT